MIMGNKPNTKAIGLSAWGALTAMTVLLYLLGDIPTYPSRALPLLWFFFSWNFYAYSFGKRMWPWQLIELNDPHDRKPGVRALWFWLTAILYAALLATIAWPD